MWQVVVTASLTSFDLSVPPAHPREILILDGVCSEALEEFRRFCLYYALSPVHSGCQARSWWEGSWVRASRLLGLSIPPAMGLNLPVARSQGNRPLAPTPVDPTRPVHHAAEVDPVLLRGPGPFPRRPDDRRAPASARDVVADVHARLLWNEWKSSPGSLGPCSDGSCRRDRKDGACTDR